MYPEDSEKRTQVYQLPETWNDQTKRLSLEFFASIGDSNVKQKGRIYLSQLRDCYADLSPDDTILGVACS